MFCYCKKTETNLGHIDVDISDIEQNTKNNDSYSPNKKNININNNNNKKNKCINEEMTNKDKKINENQNTILSFKSIFINNLNQNNINSSNIDSINKYKNENILNNKPINNTSRIALNGKIKITKSENYKFNYISNNQNCYIIKEETKNNNQALNKYNNFYYYNNNTILSKMTDNFSYRDDTTDFTNLIYILNNRIITEEEILTTPKLKIVGNPIDFFDGKEILINAAGVINKNEKINKIYNSTILNVSTKILPTNINFNNYDNQSNSIRIITNENKGITFFGQNNINYNNNRNFVSINYNKEKFSDYNKSDIFFYIYYLRETKKYYLRPNKNCIMFLKLKPKIGYPIKQGEYLSFDNVILMIKRNKSVLNNYLSIDYNQETFIFKDEDYINKNKYIKIGRNKKCDIIIENRKSISRVNAIIKYNHKIEEWEIYDGDENNRESLNGISILLRNQYEINDNCEIEFIGQRFKIQLITDNKSDTN